MKAELIVPAVHKDRRKQKKTLLPPLGLAMVAALTPPDVEVSLTDENVADIDFRKELDLVGITALTSTAQRAYEIADTFRARGVKVVLGGIHPSILPEEAGQHADAVVVGEAEGLWPNLVEVDLFPWRSGVQCGGATSPTIARCADRTTRSALRDRSWDSTTKALRVM